MKLDFNTHYLQIFFLYATVHQGCCQTDRHPHKVLHFPLVDFLQWCLSSIKTFPYFDCSPPSLNQSKKYTTTRGSMTSAHCSPGLRSLPGCLCRPSRLLRPGSCAASQTSWRALCNQTNTIFETVRRGYGWQRQAKVILEKKCKK